MKKCMKMLRWTLYGIGLMLFACGNSNETPGATQNVSITFNVDSAKVDFSAGSIDLTVKANDEWGVSSDQSWCTVSPTGNVAGTTAVTLTFTKNDTQTSRVAVLTFKRNSYTKTFKLIQQASPSITLADAGLLFGYKSSSKSITINATSAWTVESDQSWCRTAVSGANAGTTTTTLTVDENTQSTSRTATLSFKTGSYVRSYVVQQGCNEGTDNVNIVTPDGYVLMWHDEFNTDKASMPSTSEWWYETGASGWGNNELENYVAGKTGNDTLAYVSNGSLKIYARKINNTVNSIRMNTNKAWTYGYFEARLKLPGGKGSWPAFWMLAKNFAAWPADGEIDIMEEVGVDPNLVSCTIHCSAYNSTINTQKTSRKFVDGAEGQFHVYAVEWTASYIKGFVDGVNYFTFYNDGTGNKATWPYNVPFYLKLNLAWGGNWGGYKGVDDTALPLTYEIDYVRVFQK